MTELDLYSHQKTALAKLRNGKILYGGVGTGKSRVAVAYYLQNEAPKDVYVITTALKRNTFDWQEEFYRAGIGPRSGPVDPQARSRKGRSSQGRRREEDQASSIGVVDGSKIESRVRPDSGLVLQRPHQRQQDERDDGVAGRFDGLGDGQESLGGSSSPGEAGTYPYVLTVDSWNNIAKYADVEGAFWVFDEQRLVGSGDWTRKFLRIAKHNRWILLSGTPGDTWMDYIPVFVANNFYKNRSEFKREHVVYNTFTKFPKVDRYINVGRLARQRSQLLVEMPFVRHTRRRHVEVPLRYDKETLDRVLKDRWHVYEDRPLRDVGEMCGVSRKVVNSDPSRLEMVCELWKIHPRLIVFYNFNYELEALRTVLMDTSLVGETYLPEIIGSRKNSSLMKDSNISSGKTTLDKSSTSWSSSKKEISTPSSCSIPASIPCDSCRTGLSSLTDGLDLTSLVKRSAGISTTTSLPTATSMSLAVEERDGLEWNPWTNKPSSPKSNETCGGSSKSDSTSGKQTSGTKSATATGIQQGSSIAEWNGHKHQPIPNTDRWLYLVQYVAGAEGWNCTETDAMIFYSRNYSWKVYEQAQGRIDRLNTPFSDLWYYDFMTDSWIDKAIGRSLRAKESFQESRYSGLLKG